MNGVAQNKRNGINGNLASVSRILPLIFVLSFWIPGVLPGATPDNKTAAAPGSAVVGEVINRIRYVVGDMPITDIDIENMMDYLQKTHAPLKGVSLHDAAVDELETRAIVDLEARDESIIVSDARIENEVKRRKEFSGITDDEKFKQTVERETGLPYDVWLNDLQYQIKKRQVVQIRVNVPLPEDSEVEKFYQENRTRIGYEVSYREIVVRPTNPSIAEEQRVSQLARNVWVKVRQNPSLFDSEARNLTENVSPYRSAGGLHPYSPLQEVAQSDQILAGVLYSMGPGEISSVFRNSNNQYMIVQLVAKRPVSLDKVRDIIRQRLYIENEDKAFDEWIKRRKKEISIVSF